MASSGTSNLEDLKMEDFHTFASRAEEFDESGAWSAAIYYYLEAAKILENIGTHLEPLMSQQVHSQSKQKRFPMLMALSPVLLPWNRPANIATRQMSSVDYSWTT